MDPKTEKPLRLFINPFALWTDLAFKTGQAMWASAHAAALRSNAATRVAVIPGADAPGPDTHDPKSEEESARADAIRHAKVAVLPVGDAPRKPRPPNAQPSKVVRFKASRAKLRSKASAKRRARR